jgi:hypothetical protein
MLSVPSDADPAAAFHVLEAARLFITGFTEETEPVKVRATRGLSANVQVRFDPETDHELEARARERGMKKATLIRTWVLERL